MSQLVILILAMGKTRRDAMDDARSLGSGFI